jgi:hypothetical protein
MKKLDVAANIAVLCSAALLSFVLLTQYIVPSHVPSDRQQVGRAEGKTLTLSGVKWSAHKQSLVMAVSTHCVYCIRSIPFYQKLSAAAASHQLSASLIAVLPDDIPTSKSFLLNHQISVDQITQAQLSDLGVDGTPTLLLVDERGTVKREWVGLLNPDVEKQVISQIKM